MICRFSPTGLKVEISNKINNKMSITKLFSVITTLAVVAMLVGPVVPAQAATAEELATQIAQLQEQLNLLMGQLNVAQSSTPDTTPVTTGAECSGINFDRNLTVGSKGNDVKCLQTILNRSADTRLPLLELVLMAMKPLTLAI